MVHYDISGTIEISATGEGTRASIDFEIEQRNALANSEMPAADYRLQKPKVFFDRDIGPLEIPGGREEGPFIGEPNVEYYHYEEVSWSIPYPYPRDVFYVQLTMGQVLGSYPVDELPGYLDPGGFEIDLWTGDVHNLGYY